MKKTDWLGVAIITILCAIPFTVAWFFGIKLLERRKKGGIPNFQTEAKPELFTTTEITTITPEIVENKVNSMIENMEVEENNQPSATVIDVENESENLNNNEQKAEEEV
jgi:hypothetical protein